MGLFDFLKRSQPAVPIKPVISNRSECGISKTKIIADLFKIPRDKRDKEWFTSFYENVATASIACDNPQTLKGPDRFTYFILKTPEETKPFESFCIQNMKDDFLLNNALDIVFNPGKNNYTDWVFTHRDIVNFHLNNTFFTQVEGPVTDTYQFTKTTVVMKNDEKVLIAQPSECYLPAATKNALKQFLQSKGIKTSKLMMVTSVTNGVHERKLIFNIHPEDYPKAVNLEYLMQLVAWFLPNNYILIPLPKKSELASGFQNL